MDNSDDYYIEQPEAVVTREMALDAGEPEMEGQLIWSDSNSRTDAELHGELYPRNGTEYDDVYEWERSLEEA